ncbi:RNA replicase [Margalitia sp. FSL K6-0131]|uniref:rolling circle replication-associated protein n=1 Tax=Margalitia sp. FSL K6-0131 TaxID=2954604 RepID=UPI0030FA940A
MDGYDCEMKWIESYIKIKRYGKEIRKRGSSRKTKAERKAEIKEIKGNSGFSALEKMIQVAILGNNGAGDKENGKRTIKTPKARNLKMKEIEVFSDLMDMNFKVGDKYVTLTYGKEEVSLDEAGRDFENWIKRMRDRYSDFKYLGVRSFQKRGTIHFHVLMDIPDIPAEELRNGIFQNIWGHGIVNVKMIHSQQIVDRYAKLKKYLIKNLSEFKADERSFGKRLYLQSNNLIKPKIIRGNYFEIMEYLGDIEGGLKKVDGRRFSVEFLNYIEVQTFKIMEPKEEIDLATMF